MRVLVLRFSAVGDLILTLPAMRLLREAGATVLLGTRAPLDELLAGEEWIEPLTLGRGEGLARYIGRLRAAGPDQILDLHGSLRSRLIALAMPEVPVVRWEKRPAWEGPLASLGLRRPRASGRTEERMRAAAEVLAGLAGAAGAPAAPVRLRVHPDAAARVRDLVPPGAVCLCPGAGHATKQWPIRHFLDLYHQLRAAGRPVLLTGSPAERDLCRPLLDAGAIDLLGLPLRDLPALLAACAATVANDSGPMHISRAVGTPTVALFGPTDPAMFDLTGATVLRHDPGCAPCSFFGGKACPLGHHRCMEELLPEQTAAHLLS